MRPGWAQVEMCGRRGRHWLHGLDGLHLVLHGIRGSLRLGVLCLAGGGGGTFLHENFEMRNGWGFCAHACGGHTHMGVVVVGEGESCRWASWVLHAFLVGAHAHRVCI